MTVANKIPLIAYPNTTGIDTFDYDWDMLPESIIEALLDDVLIETGVVDNGGTVTITPAPTGDLVLRRRTPVWQPEDYAFARGFKANKTELTIDRTYLIAQELRSGGSVIADISERELINGVFIDSLWGNNAFIPLWGNGAGVFSGEVTETAPDDDSVTSNPESFVWMQYGTGIPAPLEGLPNLFYMQDFDAQGKDLGADSVQNIGWQMVNDLYGYGDNNGGTIGYNGFGAVRESRDGMHGDNAAYLDGTVESVMQLNQGDSPNLPANYATVYTIDEHTHLFWFYVTQIGTYAGLSNTGSLGTDGIQVAIDDSGNIQIDIGDFGLQQTFTTVAAVTLDAYNFLAFSHNPTNKTVSVSLTPEGTGTRNATETFTYTTTYVTDTLGLLIAGGDNNGVAYPMLDGSRIAHWSLWDYDMPIAEMDRIFNGGVGRTTSQYFEVANHWPAQRKVGSESTTRPRIDLFIPGDWSTFKSTTLLPSTVADSTGDGVVGYQSQQAIGDMNSGTNGAAPVIQQNVQNGLSVLRVAGTIAQGMSNSWVPQAVTNVSFFFAGSTKNAGTGIIANVGAFNRCNVQTRADGSFGFYNGSSTTWCNPSDNAGDDTFFIGAVSFDGTTGVVKIFMNGALSATNLIAGAGQNNGGSGWLLSVGLSGNNQFVGDMGHFIGYLEPLSDVDVIEVCDWMNDIWAVY